MILNNMAAMFRICVMILIAFNAVKAQAQGTLVRIEKDNAREIKGELVKGKRAPASGTNYLYEDWRKGLLVLTDGTRIALEALKFDLIKQELYYQQSGNLFLVNQPVKEFHVIATEGTRIFRKGYPSHGRQNEKTFYELLYEDNEWQLLKLIRKTLEEKHEFQVGTKLAYIDLESFYLLRLPVMQWYQVSKDSRSFQPFYAGNEKAVQLFVDTHGRKFENEIAMVQFMNQFKK